MHRIGRLLLILPMVMICFMCLILPWTLNTSAVSDDNIAAMQIGKPIAYINGKKTSIDPNNSSVVPIIKNGRTLVPLRFCASAMGGTTNYINDKSYITVAVNNLKAQFMLGSKTLKILDNNGKLIRTITLDVAPVILNGRTMVPIRATTEGLLFKVYYKKIGSKEYVLVSQKALTAAQQDDEINRLQGILPMKLSMTMPKENEDVNGSIKVAGYALSEASTKITIKLDGAVLTSDAERFLDNAFLNSNDPKYRAATPKPGFTYTLDTSPYTEGKHTVTVIATGSDGRSISESREINVIGSNNIISADKSYIPFGVISSPVNATITIPKSISITGWAVHPKETRVDIYINGSKQGTAARTANSSVLDSYPAFATTTPKPGFSYTWDASSATSGRNEIVAKVVEIDTGNVVQNIKSVIFLLPTTSGESFAKVNVSTGTLNLRKTASSSGTVIGALEKNQFLYLLSTDNSTWWKVKTLDGELTGFASSTYLVKTSFPYSSDVPCFSLTEQSSISNPAVGQTLYIYASYNGSNVNKKLIWKSSDPSVANVYDGYVYAYKEGTATITAKNMEGTYSVTRTVNVKAPKPIITAYTSPNIVSPGEDVKLIVVTDSSRDAIKAVVDNGNGTSSTLYGTDYTISGMRRIFTISTSVSKEGNYGIKLYSSLNDVYTLSDVTTSIFASGNYDSSTPKVATRRSSDKGLQFIAAWEGYSKEVYIDSLGTPTIGYGEAIFQGNVFYDVLSQEEAWAMLVSEMNGSYTTNTSKFLTNNNIKVTQWEFDALVSFAYNVGQNIWTTAPSSYKCMLRDQLKAKANGTAGSIPDNTVIDAFSRYHKGLRGVYYRRLDEAQMFNTGDYNRDNWSYEPYKTCTLPPKDGKI